MPVRFAGRRKLLWRAVYLIRAAHPLGTTDGQHVWLLWGVRAAETNVRLAHGQVARITSSTPPSTTNQCRKPEGSLSGAAPIAIMATPRAMAG